MNSKHAMLWSRLILGTALLAAAPVAAGAATTGPKTPPPAKAEAGDDHHDAEHGAAGHDTEGAHGPDSEEHGAEHGHGGGHGSSRLSDVALPLQLEGFPERPKPILELGEPFLGTGTLHPGFKLPTGAVWQPSLLAFGSLRTGLQSFTPGGSDNRTTEWANRLDLFLNLYLSGTERLVVGFRNFDRSGRFSGYVFESPDPSLDGEFRDEFDIDVEVLFFEGEFGEIFPNLDREDRGSLDVGFSIGRQPMFFQEGMLIQDTLDGVGLTRNTLLPKNTSNFRATLFFAWDNVHRGGIDLSDAEGSLRGANPEDTSGQLLALLTSTDVRRSTLDADLVYVQSDNPLVGDLAAFGISAVQRIGKMNSSFRLLGSFAIDDETAFSTDGALLFSELSWTPVHTHNLFYVNNFLAMDTFTSAARGPATGGPLGRAGINFAAVGLGSYGAALSSTASDVVGGAVGYQMFFDHTRKQVIVEVGARFGLENDIADAFAATARFQTAIGRRLVLVVDGFVGHLSGLPGSGDETLYGGRLELLTKF